MMLPKDLSWVAMRVGRDVTIAWDGSVGCQGKDQAIGICSLGRAPALLVVARSVVVPHLHPQHVHVFWWFTRRENCGLAMLGAMHAVKIIQVPGLFSTNDSSKLAPPLILFFVLVLTDSPTWCLP